MISGRRVTREVPRLPGPGGHRRAAPQRQLLRRPLPRATAASRSAEAIDDFAHARRRASACSSPCPAARTRSALWDILVELGYDADGLVPRSSASATTATSPASYARALRRRARASTLREIDLPRRVRLRRPDRGARRPAACRARRAGSPSATSSTRPRSTAATTPSPPATTSTTRPPCCSATCCGGTPTTSAASCPCCPRARLPAKVKPLVRLGERETAAYCVLRGIDYMSRSARWPRATATSATRRR